MERYGKYDPHKKSGNFPLRLKADLHMHGPIGFQDYWLKVQGYEGTNPLEEIAKTCFSRDVGICAITSDENDIPRNSVHDRFSLLKNKYVSTLPEDYETDTLGKNILIVADSKNMFFLVNGQTVRARDNGRQVDHLVVGANDVPIGRNLDDTLKYVMDKGLLSIAEHPLCVSHGGIGKEKLEGVMPYIDAVEGHNSQLILPEIFSKVPVFKEYAQGINRQTQKISEQYEKPWIAVSDAHRIEDAGISYIEFNQELLDIKDSDRFLESLKEVIKNNKFDKRCGYEDENHLLPIDWFNWVSKLVIGQKLGKDK